MAAESRSLVKHLSKGPCMVLRESHLENPERPADLPVIKPIKFDLVINSRPQGARIDYSARRAGNRRRGYRIVQRLPLLADIVAKVLLRCRTKILRAADAFCARRCEGPCRLIQNRSRTSVVALKSDAVAERSKDQLSRDFLGCSIFDFLQQNLPEPDSCVAANCEPIRSPRQPARARTAA
jgi:hypothetical protein